MAEQPAPEFDPTKLPEQSALAQAATKAAEAAEAAEAAAAKSAPPTTPAAAAHEAAREAGAKFYGDIVSVQPAWQFAGGAQSFTELDDYRSAEAVELAINEETWTFEMLIDNIMRDLELTASEKATKVRAVADELTTRVRDAEQEALAEGVRETGDPGFFHAFRDKRGDLRWLAAHSNNYKDREGETFSADSHTEFVDWVDRTKSFPKLRLWHIPHDLGEADMVDFDGTFMLSSGTFSKEYEFVGEALERYDGELGCSHGFQYRPDDLQDGVYERYRSFEVSVLPMEVAANLLTAFFARGELPQMNEAKREWITELAGPELVATMEDGLGQLKDIADKRGLSYKDMADAVVALKDDEAETPAPETPTPEAAATPAPEAATAAPETEVTEPEAATPAPAPETDADGDDANKEAADILGEIVTKAVKAANASLVERLDALEANKATVDAEVADAIRPPGGADRALAHSKDGTEVPAPVAEALKNALDSPEEGDKALDPAAPYAKMLGND